MHVIVCLDEQNGMLFNGRRQSRDRAVTEDIIKMAGGALWAAEYAKELFAEGAAHFDEQMLEKAGAEAYCFVEKQALRSYEDRISSVTVYRWHWRYPADQRLDIALEDWRLESQTELAGFSHERISKEVYRR